MWFSPNMPTRTDMKSDQHTISLPNCTAAGQPILIRSRIGPRRTRQARRVPYAMLNFGPRNTANGMASSTAVPITVPRAAP
jgi:hypothetical protein